MTGHSPKFSLPIFMNTIFINATKHFPEITMPTPAEKYVIGQRGAENGVTATLHCYAKKISDL